MAATAPLVPSPQKPRLRAVGLGWLALTALAIAGRYGPALRDTLIA